MSSLAFFDNLRPGERRFLVIVLTVVFIVLNAVLVWPRLDDWKTVQQEIEQLRRQRAEYLEEINRTARYERQIRELEGQGSAVLPEARALDLLRTVQEKARLSGVVITQTRTATSASATSRTNAFFDEQALTVGITTGPKELIEFLYSIGTGESMIRVRDMDLRPTRQRYQLDGNLTFIASYQKAKPNPPPSAAGGASRVSP
ncbi:MAG: hypothetical protein D6766_10170 [Verrucomicrobia bacterium]|nr:MAG: hypothetical protein D6766_10170 [Verrucomicrobiota bacterium]